MWNYKMRITGERFTKDSKGFKILKYIAKHNGATKYECITKVLKKCKEIIVTTKSKG
jgi:hypothetical protein